ncbi:hypothetical protein BJX96DRAFT_153738 [Aspergillus floccosus]
MSEKYYDSDAQYIATPKQVAEYPSIRSRIWGRVSPLGQSLYEPLKDVPCDGPREVTEQTRPAGGSRFIEHSDIEILPFEWQAPGCIESEPSEPTQRQFGSPRPVYPPGYSQDLRFRDPMSVIHEDHQPQPCNDVLRATVSIGHTEHDSQRDTVDNSVDRSENTQKPSLPLTTSADSVAAPYAELSVRKKRRRSSVERQQGRHSVHLGEINIPRALASTPTPPRGLSPDQSQDGSGDSTVSGASRRYSHPVGSFEYLSTWNNGALNLGNPSAASSIYSRPTSLSSGPSKYRFESRIFSHLYHNSPDGIAECPSTLEENMDPCNPHDTMNEIGPSSQASAAHTKIDDEPLQGSKRVPSWISDSHSDPSSTRKVSVGWMTKGRRLGYGYTLISADDEGYHSPQSAPGSPAPSNPVDIEKPENKCSSENQVDTDSNSTEKEARTGKSVFDIFKVSHHFNSRHLPSKTTVKNDSSKKTGGNSVAAFLFRSPNARKKGQDIETTSTEAKTQKSDSGGRYQSLANAQDSQNEAHSHVENSKRLTKGQALRRAKTLWTRRSVGSGGVHRQSESTTPSSSGPSPPLLQRSKTQVMKRRDPCRRTPLLSDGNDENFPMFLITEETKPQMPQEAKEHNPNLVEGDPQRRLHRASSSNSMDDWLETYQDCVEFHSL